MTSTDTLTTRLNGDNRTWPAGTTYRDVVEHVTGRDIDDAGRPTTGGGLAVALAVDGAVLPRSAWATTPVTDGARIELVDAVQGG